jgi:hypothetical protein
MLLKISAQLVGGFLLVLALKTGGRPLEKYIIMIRKLWPETLALT